MCTHTHTHTLNPVFVFFYKQGIAADLSSLPLTPVDRVSKSGSIAPEYSLREVPAPPLGSTITKVLATYMSTLGHLSW